MALDSTSVRNYYFSCLRTDERLRWTAEELLQHSFIKQGIPKTDVSILPSLNQVEIKCLANGRDGCSPYEG